MIFDLVRDFADVQAAMPEGHPRRQILRLLDEAVRRDAHFISRHPTTLFQCLWNSCWWYDCPAAEPHYPAPEGGWDRLPPWGQPGPRSSQLVERWREEKEGRCPGFRWIRSLRPPPAPLGSALRAVLRGHGREQRTFAPNDVRCVAFAPDGATLASGSWDETVRLWDVTSGRDLGALRHPRGVSGVAFSPDGTRLVAGTSGGSIHIWHVASRVEERVIQGHKKHIWSVAYSPDGARIASGSSDQTVRVWDAASGTEVALLHDFLGDIADAFAADPEAGTALAARLGFDKQAWSVSFSPDGGRIASGTSGRGSDYFVRLWPLAAGSDGRFWTRAGMGYGVAFSPDGKLVAAGSDRNFVAILDADTGHVIRTLPRSAGKAFGLDRPPELAEFDLEIERLTREKEGAVAVGDFERAASLRDQADEVKRGRAAAAAHLPSEEAAGSEAVREAGHRGAVFSVAFSPDGTRLCSGSADRTVRVWDAVSGSELSVYRGHDGHVRSVAFSPDGSLVASGSDDQTVHVWAASANGELRSLQGHGQFVTPIAISPDGTRLAGGSRDHTVRVCEVASGADLAVLSGHESLPLCVALSPDGARVASGAADGTLRVWALAGDGPPVVSHGHGRYRGVRCVAFSPDGARIASGGEDRNVRVWAAADGTELRVLEGHHGYVTHVEFSPDGRRITSRDDSSETTQDFDDPEPVLDHRLWDSDTGRCLGACRAADKLPGEPPVPFRVRGLVRESVVEAAATGEGAAYYPAELQSVSADPTGRIWAGRTAGGHLHLITLAGPPLPAGRAEDGS